MNLMYVSAECRRPGRRGPPAQAGNTTMERSTNSRTPLRIAAIGDIHVSKTSQGTFQPLFAQISSTADVLVLCGDFTDYGLPDEARILARELTASVKIPVIAVLGNHDYESGQAGRDPADPHRCRRHRARRRGHRGPWRRLCRREGLCRRLRPRRARPVGRAGDQAVRAGSGGRSAEARSRAGPAAHASGASPCCTTRRFAAPSKASRRRSFRISGSSRLEEPINRYRVSAVFHGHAHRGVAGRAHGHRRAGLQRGDAAAGAAES